MVTLPVRGLAQQGIIRDIAPYDLPLNAWSGGTNVRFANGKACRAPVFRTASALTPLTDGAGVVSYKPTSGYDSLFGLDSGGSAALWTPGSGMSDVSGVGFTPSVAATQHTSCTLSDILYIARGTHLPRYWGAASSVFATLPNWPGTYKTGIIRSFYSFLVAFGVNKAGTNFPNLVKWSDATLAGTYPATWDPTVATNLAGETPLSQLNSQITDAQNLKGVMMIYGLRQSWVMEYTGNATFPMVFNKLFEDRGAISVNCSVEANGQHYVFGPTDIWTHDGTSAQSIATDRVRQWVYQNLNASLASRCFAYHDPTLTTVGFAFCSADSDTPFGTTLGCNKAAEFNYGNNTWGFRDLPCITAATTGNANLALTWTTCPGTLTWANMGGSWADQRDTFKPALFVVGNTDSNPTGISANLYASDPMDKGSRVALPADAFANTASFVSRDGIDLDEAKVPLSNFKWVSNVYPQANIYRDIPITLQLGTAATPQGLPNYTNTILFNPSTDYQLNTRSSGRYLSMRFQVTGLADWEITGFDLDILSGGRR